MILNIAIDFIQSLPQHCQNAGQVYSDSHSTAQNHAAEDTPKTIAEPGDEVPGGAGVVGETGDHQAAPAEDGKWSGELQRDSWTLDEKDSLFQFVTKVLLMNFPMYMAYKHSVNTSLEELSQQETAALNNYCEISVRSTARGLVKYNSY